MELSTYQQSILDAVGNRLCFDGLGQREWLRGLLIEALAGTGKSFILVEICKVLADAGIPSDAVKLVVFGKKNKVDLAKRLEKKLGYAWGDHCVSTLHSLSFSILKEALGVPSGAWKVESSKYRQIAERLGLISARTGWGANSQKSAGSLWVEVVRNLPAAEQQQRVDELDAEFLQLVELLRLYCYEPTEENIETLIKTHGLSSLLSNLEPLKGAMAVLEEGLNLGMMNFWIDYTDMSWLVWMEREHIQLTLQKWRDRLRFVAVDEAQDTDLLQLNILSLLIDPARSFLCAVGDRRQAVYAFRGCVSDGLDRFKEKFNCEIFPLPVNYRCGKSHLELVRKFDPAIPIEPAPDAADGEIRVLKPDQFLSLFEDESLTYMGVCRKNAPLIVAAIKLLGAGKPCKIKDKSLGKKVIDQVEKICRRLKQKYSAESFPLMIREFEKLERDRLLKYPDGEQKLSELSDLLEAIRALFEQYEPSSIKEWGTVIDKIFDESSHAPINLYSIHSGKGGEAEVSFILAADKMPMSHKKMTAAEREQESNLIYVALTRPQKTLAIFCEDFPSWLPSDYRQWWKKQSEVVEELSVAEKQQQIWEARGFYRENGSPYKYFQSDDEYLGWDVYLYHPNGGITSVDVVRDTQIWIRHTEEDFDQDAAAIIEYCKETIRLVEAAEIPEGQLTLEFPSEDDVKTPTTIQKGEVRGYLESLVTEDDDDIAFVEEQLMSSEECEAQDFYELLQTVERLPLAKQATIIREIGDRLGNAVVLGILGV